MTKVFDEWLVELAKNESCSLLEKLPDFLRDQYAQAGNMVVESGQADHLSDRECAPDTIQKIGSGGYCRQELAAAVCGLCYD